MKEIKTASEHTLEVSVRVDRDGEACIELEPKFFESQSVSIYLNRDQAFELIESLEVNFPRPAPELPEGYREDENGHLSDGGENFKS